MAGNRAIAQTNGRKGGRPKDAIQLRTRLRAHELGHTHETPLDVMVDNMLFWHRHVGELSTQLRSTIINIEDKDEQKEAFKLLGELLASRANAQACAVDAAPYMHAKYHSIEFQADDNTLDVTASEIPADPTAAAITYQRLISGKK